MWNNTFCILKLSPKNYYAKYNLLSEEKKHLSFFRFFRFSNESDGLITITLMKVCLWKCYKYSLKRLWNVYTWIYSHMSQRSLVQTFPNNYCVLKNIPHPHCSHSTIKRSGWPPGRLRVKTYNQIVMFHNYISPSGEQPQQCIWTHTPVQITAAYIPIFHKYCCCIKHGSMITNLTLWNPSG